MFSRIIPDTWRARIALAAPAVIALCLVGAALLPGGLIAHPAAALALWLVVVTLWLLGTGCAGAASARRLLVLVLLLRGVGLLATPSLSDDIFRYVHEGRASRLGLPVPFAVPPSRVTPPPDDGTTARVNHPDVPAAYPPTSQLFFLATVAAGDLVRAPTSLLRLLLALADALVLLLLYRRREQAPLAFVVYGLHPLPLLEAVMSSHIDALGVLLVGAALLWAIHPLLRGALVGLALGVKPIALFALVGERRRPRRFRLVLVGVALGALAPTLPYLVERAPLTRGIVEYGTRWEAQPTLYAVVERAVAPPFLERHARDRYTHAHLAFAPFGLLVEEAGVPLVSVGDARVVERPLLVDQRLAARLVCGVLLLLALAFVVARVREPERRVAYAFAALWLLAPTLHPWYLLWLLPFAALSSSWALLSWSASAPLVYEAAMRAHATGEWREALWPRALMLTALVLGALVDGARARRAQSRGPAPAG